MKIKKLLAPILILCLCPVIVAAQSNDREALRGIGAVGVAIYASPGVKEGGLTEDRLKTTAELGLRRNGIAMGSTSAVLSVKVTAVESRFESGRLLGFAAFIEVSLTEGVIVVRSSRSIIAPIWEKGTLIIYSEDAFSRNVREVVGELIDDFSNDYLAVNPK